MTVDFEVRWAVAADAESIAEVHVNTWRETYAELMNDDALNDPALLSRRKEFWTAALSDPRYSKNRVAVASVNAALIGIAMAGPTFQDTGGPEQLHLLYVYKAFHGKGVGIALLNAVLYPAAPAVLWVADPNPRAQAFYRKHGFAADTAVKVESGVRSVRMIRAIFTPNCR